MTIRAVGRLLSGLFFSGVLMQSLAVGPARWPLWENYGGHFPSSDGRVPNHDRLSSGTSEGQAYALFSSLANDQPRFERILSWTQDNLVRGDLAKCLPAWHWEKSKSYLPVQLLLGLAEELPGGPWNEIAESIPEVLHGRLKLYG